MFNYIISANAGDWGMIAILGGFFVVMMVMTILPQKKRQKQMQEMMNNLVVGTKVMTIGRMIGTVESIDTENNQVILNVGTASNPTLITIDRNAIGVVMDKKETAPVVSDSATVEEAKSDDITENSEKN